MDCTLLYSLNYKNTLLTKLTLISFPEPVILGKEREALG